MSHLTRRGFVTSSAKATAGATVLGGLLAEQATAKANAASGGKLGHPGSEPVVAYVRDPSSGDVSVMVGDREVTVHDPDLAARIAHSAG
jgi:hypothetical protein